MSSPPAALDASAPPADAFSDTENGAGADDDAAVMAACTSSPSSSSSRFPPPPMPRLGSLGVHEPYVRSLVQRTRGWPRAGVTFLDVSPLLADARALRHCVDSLAQRYGGGHLTHVAGVDARGFTLACALAYKLGCGFIMVRKAGKLPPGAAASANGDGQHDADGSADGALLSEQYEMEYGTSQLQIRADLLESSTPRVLLLDDLLATGGTACAACNLLRTAGATIVEVAVLIELCSPQLCGRRRLKQQAYIDLFSLICVSEQGSPCV